uniref:Uncharacterized protein n=1 Tax=Solanum lycopersicum TaxID=4081 RepID=K4CGA0_SOLLC
MEVSMISDTLTAVVTTQGLGVSKFLLNRNLNFSSNNVFSISDSSSEQQSPSTAGVRQISAVICPIDALAPPPVKYNKVKAAPRRLARKTRRIIRKSLIGGADEESSSNSFSDPAFDFVYELMCWAALSNCLHFAFKKVVRIVAGGFSDTAREKVVPVRLTSVY